MPIRGGKAYNQHSTYKAAVLRRDGHHCQLCGCGLGETCARHAYMPVEQLDVAHVVPFKAGGLSTPENMQVQCHRCNLSHQRAYKENRPLELPQYLAYVEQWANG